MDKRIPITVQGAEKLRAELDELKRVKRPAVVAAIAEAREKGDLSENAEYDAAKEMQGHIEGMTKRTLRPPVFRFRVPWPAVSSVSSKVTK